MKQRDRGEAAASEAGRRGPFWSHGAAARSGMLALLLLSLAAAANAGQGRNIRFERISIREGLSQATVNCLLQDQVGFIWLGTQDGLNRYDGYDFVVYNNDPGNAESLADNWIQALLEDPSGDIWVGTRGGGLSRWRRATGTFITLAHDPDDPASLASNQVRALLLDRDGRLWVGTELDGLDLLEPETGTVIHHRHDPDDPTSLPGDQVRALYEDRRGRLWVGTVAGGLARINRAATGRAATGRAATGRAATGRAAADGATVSFVNYRHDPEDPGSLSHDHVRAILEDREGSLWIGTVGGLDRFDDATGTFEHFRHDPANPASLSATGVRSLLQDAEGRLWVGASAGLNLFDYESGTFDRYLHDPADPESLPKDRIMDVDQDRGGVLWVATQGGGIARWDPRAWSFASLSIRPSALSGRDVLAFAEDGEGRLWIGTNGNGLNRVDRTTGEVTHFIHDPDDPRSLSGVSVTSLLVDRRSTLWAGTLRNGLNRMDRRTGTFHRFRHDSDDPTSLAANTVGAILEDRRGELWIGTFAGLSRIVAPQARQRSNAPEPGRQPDAPEPETLTFTNLHHDPEDPASLSDNRIIALAEDSDGSLWIATLGGGLNRLPGGTGASFHRFRHDPEHPESLTSDGLMSLHVDPTGTLWIGAQAGLNRLERFDEATGEAEFRRYFTEDGLPNEFIYGIRSDAGGGLWLSTNLGLSRFDPRTDTFKNYDTSHGLQADEFNFGAHYKSASGELFFGGINGFNAFFPDRIRLNNRPPPVVLTRVSVLDRPVSLGRPIFDLDGLDLGHRDSIVSFEFAALDYTAPERNRYRYQLEGFNEEWIDLGNRRLVSFTNLDPGRYVLRLQGSNNDGVWNEDGAEISIAVAPPPWLTWWAWTLYALALGAVVFAFIRSQQGKVEREREVNRRLKEVDELRGELLGNLKDVVEERTEQVAERERLLAELEVKNAELERFNYTVSHDLKSPLVTIKGFLGMLERDTAAGRHERARHDIRRINAAADKMQQLLDELLHLSRMSHEATEPVAVPIDEVAREALEAVAGAVDERAVAVEISADLPLVIGDRVRLRELFQNLLANAVKYMGDQQEPRVKVGMQWRGPETIFYVRDNGSGIDPRYHDKIFGLFERLVTAEEGTGIGLALVKRIVEQHGGRIWVESEGLGSGSTFCFTLQQADATAREAAGEAADEAPAKDGASVVMAEDRFRRKSS